MRARKIPCLPDSVSKRGWMRARTRQAQRRQRLFQRKNEQWAGIDLRRHTRATTFLTRGEMHAKCRRAFACKSRMHLATAVGNGSCRGTRASSKDAGRRTSTSRSTTEMYVSKREVHISGRRYRILGDLSLRSTDLGKLSPKTSKSAVLVRFVW